METGTNVTLELVDYFDVWGNEEDGWEINNLCTRNTFEMPEDFTKQDLLDELINQNFIVEGTTMDEIEFDEQGSFIEFSEKSNRYPLGRVEVREW